VTRNLALAALVVTAGAVSGCGQGGLPPPQSSGHAAANYGAPTGAFAGKKPKGLLILVHGGGWQANSRQVAAATPIANFYRSQGYATMNVDYRTGAASIEDLDRFYREGRRRVGRHVPICALGGSAGGNLALTLAARHPDLACVISKAGPTDLPALKQTDRDSYNLAVQRLGAGRLVEFSPARNARHIHAALLLIYAANDPLVPVSQATRMAQAKPGSQTIILPPGSSPFVHSDVNPAAKARSQQTEALFLARVTAARR
jgi:acetyl esterase/lipase